MMTQAKVCNVLERLDRETWETRWKTLHTPEVLDGLDKVMSKDGRPSVLGYKSKLGELLVAYRWKPIASSSNEAFMDPLSGGRHQESYANARSGGRSAASPLIASGMATPNGKAVMARYGDLWEKQAMLDSEAMTTTTPALATGLDLTKTPTKSAPPPKGWPFGSWRSSSKEVMEAPIVVSDDWTPVKDWSKIRALVLFFHGMSGHARIEGLRAVRLDQYVKETSTDGSSNDVECTSSGSEGVPDELESFSTQTTGGPRFLPKASKAKERSLRLPDESEDDISVEMLYEDSFVSAMVDAGCLVVAPDAQGHGLSTAWENSKANCRNIQELFDDAAHWVKEILLLENPPQEVPIILAGESMGGLTVIQAARILPTIMPSEFPQFDSKCRPFGLSLFAPCLGLDTDVMTPRNRYLKPVGKILSVVAPTFRCVDLMDLNVCPEMIELMNQDPIRTFQKLPIRLTYELLRECASSQACEPLPWFVEGIVLVQGDRDRVVSRSASKKFVLKQLDGGHRYVRANLAVDGSHFVLQETATKLAAINETLSLIAFLRGEHSSIV